MTERTSTNDRPMGALSMAVLDQVEAENAQLWDIIEATKGFMEKHERFHPAFWCAGRTDHRCDACDLGFAVTRLLPQKEAES